MKIILAFLLFFKLAFLAVYCRRKNSLFPLVLQSENCQLRSNWNNCYWWEFKTEIAHLLTACRWYVGFQKQQKSHFYLKENIFAIKTFEKYKDLNLYDLNHTNLYFLRWTGISESYLYNYLSNFLYNKHIYLCLG